MITLAICDDDIESARSLAEKVEKMQLEVPVSVSVYRGSEPFWYEVQGGRRFDILLLDIEMPGMNGMELAGKVRRCIPDICMVFITAYEHYVYDCFAFHPYSYIHKSQLASRLEKVIRDIVTDILRMERHVCLLKDGHMIEKVSINRIVKVMRDMKYAVFTIQDGYDEAGKMIFRQLRVRDSIKNVYAKLPASEFALVSQSIVNLSQVIRIDGFRVFLKDETELPIARGKINDFKNTYLKFYSEKEGGVG